MKMLFSITLPHGPFNAAVKDGTVGAKLGRLLETMKPESIYFTDRDGLRGAVAVVDVADGTKVPAICEPWFLVFEAKITTHFAMTPADLQKAGLDAIGKNWT